MVMKGLKAKNALITGASSGIGQQITHRIWSLWSSLEKFLQILRSLTLACESLDISDGCGCLRFVIYQGYAFDRAGTGAEAEGAGTRTE